jgi:serine/threonine-protein kinase HipA
MDLRVMLGTVPVGALSLRHGNLSSFRFDEAYITLPDRPVLGRWFEDQISPGFTYQSPQSRLPPFFQNYLPEEGSALRQLVARRAGVKEHWEFQILEALGRDLPGAIVVEPSGDRGTQPAAAADEAAAGAPEQSRLRFSLAGIQLKFSVACSETRFTLPASGMGGSWIVKLPDRGHARVPENEFSALTWARESGIEVPDFQLVPVSEIGGLPAELEFEEELAFAVKRFDRHEGLRIHQEDFAQVLNKPASEKYEKANYTTLANVIGRVCGSADFEEFVRRLVFMVLSGNSDAHLKNWSFIYPDGRRPRLSPAYDLVSTIAYPGLDVELALPLSRTRNYFDVGAGHFVQMAAKARMSEARTAEIVGEASARIRASWRSLRSDLPLRAEARAAIERHVSKVQL